VLAEVTRNSHSARNAAASEPSGEAADLILKSKDRGQLFSRKVILLLLTKKTEENLQRES